MCVFLASGMPATVPYMSRTVPSKTALVLSTAGSEHEAAWQNVYVIHTLCMRGLSRECMQGDSGGHMLKKIGKITHL